MRATPILGWAPDADPTTPGILRAGDFIPTSRGIRGPLQGLNPLAVGTGSPTIARGQFNLRFATDLRSYYTSGGIWEHVGINWTLRTGLLFGSTEPWSMVAFDNRAYASDRLNGLLSSAAGGSFAPVATAPSAAHLVSVGAFVMALDLDGAANRMTWHCSPIGNPLGDWTPSLATQATTGRLSSDGGRITAALSLGERVVAYKANSIYVGAYVGPPEVFRWEKVASDVGCLGASAVADIGNAHLFVGERGVYIFDGVRAAPIGEGVAARSMFAQARAFGIFGFPSVTYDAEQKRAYIKLNDAMPDVFVYKTDTQKWGRFNLGANVRLVMASLQSTQIPTLTRIYTNTDATVFPPLSFTTHTMGEAAVVSRARQLRAICTDTIAGARTVAGFAGDSQKTMAPSGSGASSSTGSAVKWDLRQTGRWHSFTCTLNDAGDSEVTGIEADLIAQGPR